MPDYLFKYNMFITLYKLLLDNLKETKRKYIISFYYLNDEFNIKIIDAESEEKIFSYHFPVTLEEYNNLIFVIGNDFIDNNQILISYFEPMQEEDIMLYYNSNYRDIQLDYDKAKIHIINNPYFEMHFYYFHGLNYTGYQIQDKSLYKVYKKNKK